MGFGVRGLQWPYRTPDADADASVSVDANAIAIVNANAIANAVANANALVLPVNYVDPPTKATVGLACAVESAARSYR